MKSSCTAPALCLSLIFLLGVLWYRWLQDRLQDRLQLRRSRPAARWKVVHENESYENVDAHENTLPAYFFESPDYPIATETPITDVGYHPGVFEYGPNPYLERGRYQLVPPVPQEPAVTGPAPSATAPAPVTGQPNAQLTLPALYPAAAPNPGPLPTNPAGQGTQTVFACNDCERTYPERGLLTQHITRAHVKPYNCKQCKYSFGQLSEVSRHSPCNKNRYPCLKKGCNKIFTRSDNRKRHMAGACKH